MANNEFVPGRYQEWEEAEYSLPLRPSDFNGPDNLTHLAFFSIITSDMYSLRVSMVSHSLAFYP